MPFGVDLAPVHTAGAPRAGDAETARFLGLASLMEGVAFLGRREDGRFLVEEAGFTAEYQGANLFVGRAPRCAVRAVFSGVAAPLQVRFGYAGSPMAVRAFMLPPGGRGGMIPSIPCGPMWMELSPGAACEDRAARSFRTSTAAPLAEVRCAVVPAGPPR